MSGVSFVTLPPVDVAEVRGGRGYFLPTELRWTVFGHWVHCAASGPRTRVVHGWSSEAWRIPDPNRELPGWLVVSDDLVFLARELLRLGWDGVS